MSKCIYKNLGGYCTKYSDEVVREPCVEGPCGDEILPLNMDEAAALVKAKAEGRLVVLGEPRKPLVWGDESHDSCLCPDCGFDLMGLYGCEQIVVNCPKCGQYVDATKAITRAEAEAALGGGGDD